MTVSYSSVCWVWETYTYLCPVSVCLVKAWWASFTSSFTNHSHLQAHFNTLHVALFLWPHIFGTVTRQHPTTAAWHLLKDNEDLAHKIFIPYLYSNHTQMKNDHNIFRYSLRPHRDWTKHYENKWRQILKIIFSQAFISHKTERAVTNEYDCQCCLKTFFSHDSCCAHYELVMIMFPSHYFILVQTHKVCNMHTSAQTVNPLPFFGSFRVEICAGAI